MTDNQDIFRIAAFDIGYKNYAHCVYEINKEDLETIVQKYNKLNYKRRVKGAVHDEHLEFYRYVSTLGHTVSIDNTELGDDWDVDSRHYLASYLAERSKTWDQCDLILVEKQFFQSFGGKKRGKGTQANVKAIKIGEATISYFVNNHPNLEVVEFQAQFKTYVLGAPYPQTKPQRKKWCTKKAQEVLEIRGDTEILEYVKSLKKKDDVSDVVCMVEAWKCRRCWN